MKHLLFLTACLLTFFVLHAQQESANTAKKKKHFVTSIRTMDNRTIKGRIYAVTDSQLVLAKSASNYSNSLTAMEQMPVPAENIKSFSVKRKNSVLKGALIGFGAGAVAGVIIGFASGDDHVITEPVYDPFSAIVVGLSNSMAMTAQEKAVGGGLALGATGAIVGTVIGALAKKKFTIGGKKEKFRDLQAEIMMKLVKK